MQPIRVCVCGLNCVAVTSSGGFFNFLKNTEQCLHEVTADSVVCCLAVYHFTWHVNTPENSDEWNLNFISLGKKNASQFFWNARQICMYFYAKKTNWKSHCCCCCVVQCVVVVVLFCLCTGSTVCVWLGESALTTAWARGRGLKGGHSAQCHTMNWKKFFSSESSWQNWAPAHLSSHTVWNFCWEGQSPGWWV